MSGTERLRDIDGLVFDIRKFSLHDGPGIRTTVFLKGCPLSCRWCHNPESRSFDVERTFRPELCLACGGCDGGDGLGKDGLFTECPADARQTVGTRMTPRAVLTEIMKDTDFYEESGGGATFSGGEPLAQPDFLIECLELCAASGIRTAVDTSGWCLPEVLDRVGPLVDLYLYDLKLVDSASHRRWTGVPSEPILGNLSRLAKRKANVWIRIPVIPGVNTGLRDMTEMADYATSLDMRYPVYLLPYHDSARGKYLRRGEDWDAASFRVPTPGELDAVERIFKDRGLTVHRGG